MGILGIAWDGMGVNGPRVFRRGCQDFWVRLWLPGKLVYEFSESSQYFAGLPRCG